jgi:hypothetical protein
LYRQYIYSNKIRKMKFTSILKKVILEQSRFELLSDALTKPSKDKEGNKVKPKMSREEFNQVSRG